MESGSLHPVAKRDPLIVQTPSLVRRLFGYTHDRHLAEVFALISRDEERNGEGPSFAEVFFPPLSKFFSDLIVDNHPKILSDLALRRLRHHRMRVDGRANEKLLLLFEEETDRLRDRSECAPGDWTISGVFIESYYRSVRPPRKTLSRGVRRMIRRNIGHGFDLAP
ncbi:MAG: hypothetical protein WC787_03720 [Patescibacteria group bacterium]